jgi:hypothetical protein
VRHPCFHAGETAAQFAAQASVMLAILARLSARLSTALVGGARIPQGFVAAGFSLRPWQTGVARQAAG